MSTQKAVYYPSVILEIKETRFGATETNLPNLYDKPIPGKTIVRVDALETLKDVWGDNILMSRDKVYELVSGSISDDKYRRLISSYYTKYAAFANFVDEKYIFGEKDVPLIKRLVVPIREMINAYGQTLCDQLSAAGGKYLITTHDYIYYAYQHDNIPNIKGMCKIC